MVSDHKGQPTQTMTDKEELDNVVVSLPDLQYGALASTPSSVPHAAAHQACNPFRVGKLVHQFRRVKRFVSRISESSFTDRNTAQKKLALNLLNSSEDQSVHSKTAYEYEV